MPDPAQASQLLSLRDARERAIAQLSDAFAHDLIDVEEFERRLTLAHRADSESEIARTVSDLVETKPSTALAVVHPAHPAADETVREMERVAAILGGVQRQGAWRTPRRVKALAVLGGVVLDFRDALLPPGLTEV